MIGLTLFEPRAWLTLLRRVKGNLKTTVLLNRYTSAVQPLRFRSRASKALAQGSNAEGLIPHIIIKIARCLIYVRYAFSRRFSVLPFVRYTALWRCLVHHFQVVEPTGNHRFTEFLQSPDLGHLGRPLNHKCLLAT